MAKPATGGGKTIETVTCRDGVEGGGTRRQHLTVHPDKSRVTTVEEGFVFLGFEFRRRQGRLYLWPCAKACNHVRERTRQVTRSIHISQGLNV